MSDASVRAYRTRSITGSTSDGIFYMPEIAVPRPIMTIHINRDDTLL